MTPEEKRTADAAWIAAKRRRLTGGPFQLRPRALCPDCMGIILIRQGQHGLIICDTCKDYRKTDAAKHEREAMRTALVATTAAERAAKRREYMQAYRSAHRTQRQIDNRNRLAKRNAAKLKSAINQIITKIGTTHGTP